MMEEDELDSELLDPCPDIYALFCHYNELYFRDSLGACTVEWSSGRMTLCAGLCQYMVDGGCRIKLSEPILKYRPSSDLKNTLLHEMIHAQLFLNKGNTDHDDHGPSFCAIMKEINELNLDIDHQKPSQGYEISVYHNFHDEVDYHRVHHWTCQLCNHVIKRAQNRTPSPSDCRAHLPGGGPCGDERCLWHEHLNSCGGEFVKTAEPKGYIDKRKRPKNPSVGRALGLASDEKSSALVATGQDLHEAAGSVAASSKKGKNLAAAGMSPIASFFTPSLDLDGRAKAKLVVGKGEQVSSPLQGARLQEMPPDGTLGSPLVVLDSRSPSGEGNKWIEATVDSFTDMHNEEESEWRVTDMHNEEESEWRGQGQEYAVTDDREEKQARILRRKEAEGLAPGAGKVEGGRRAAEGTSDEYSGGFWTKKKSPKKKERREDMEVCPVLSAEEASSSDLCVPRPVRPVTALRRSQRKRKATEKGAIWTETELDSAEDGQKCRLLMDWWVAEVEEEVNCDPPLEDPRSKRSRLRGAFAISKEEGPAGEVDSRATRSTECAARTPECTLQQKDLEEDAKERATLEGRSLDDAVCRGKPLSCHSNAVQHRKQLLPWWMPAGVIDNARDVTSPSFGSELPKWGIIDIPVVDWNLEHQDNS